MKTLSGAFVLSVKPESDMVLRVGLGWACRRPRVRPVFVVGVVAGFDEIVFGDIDNGDMGECEWARSVGVDGWPSDGLSGSPAAKWKLWLPLEPGELTYDE